ncbi:hypothetical protein [Methylobacter svalbardensis]
MSGNEKIFARPTRLLKTLAAADIFIVHGKVGELAQETAIYDAVSGKRLR